MTATPRPLGSLDPSVASNARRVSCVWSSPSGTVSTGRYTRMTGRAERADSGRDHDGSGDDDCHDQDDPRPASPASSRHVRGELIRCGRRKQRFTHAVRTRAEPDGFHSRDRGPRLAGQTSGLFAARNASTTAWNAVP